MTRTIHDILSTSIRMFKRKFLQKDIKEIKQLGKTRLIIYLKKFDFGRNILTIKTGIQKISIKKQIDHKNRILKKLY